MNFCSRLEPVCVKCFGLSIAEPAGITSNIPVERMALSESQLIVSLQASMTKLIFQNKGVYRTVQVRSGLAYSIEAKENIKNAK
jgi:hypothetical protein